MIEVTTTRSSMLRTIKYDKSKNELAIVFANGGAYLYKDVPEQVFKDMIAAESEGKYFLANIKNKYEYEKQ